MAKEGKKQDYSLYIFSLRMRRFAEYFLLPQILQSFIFIIQYCNCI